MNLETFTDVSLKYENNIARISINRPEKYNAIRINTYRELISALHSADESADCHVIMLEGEGGQFTAGNDLADFVEGDPGEVMSCVKGIFAAAANLKKVLVAAVEGVAVGIGTTILLHCDIVCASSKTRFRLPFANLGVCPEGGASVLLPQAIGQIHAREVLLTGRFFSAQEALDWGLINSIADPGRAAEATLEYVKLLLQQSLESLMATKQLMRASKADVSKVVADELEVFSSLLGTEETQKRINTLLQR